MATKVSPPEMVRIRFICEASISSAGAMRAALEALKSSTRIASLVCENAVRK
jgi:hypothetical protein